VDIDSFILDMNRRPPMNKKNAEENTDDDQEIHSKTEFKEQKEILSITPHSSKEEKEEFYRQIREEFKEVYGATYEKE
jgi:hypothetical protein